MVGEDVFGRNLAEKILAWWPVAIVSTSLRGCGDDDKLDEDGLAPQMHILRVVRA